MEKQIRIRPRPRRQVKIWQVPIAKADQEKRLVYGVVMEPGTTDTQGDVLSAETIEAACHDFMRRYRQQVAKLGLGHRREARAVHIAESYLAPAEITIGEQTAKAGSWILVSKVQDDRLWEAIKSGQYTGYSMGGYGVRLEGAPT